MNDSVGTILRMVQDHPLLRQVRLLAAEQSLLPVYLVGGFIRDAFLSRPQSLDIDLASHDPPSLGAALQQSFDGKVISLAEGVCRVVFSHRGEQVQLDISPVRGGDIVADLRRRDFTINALAISLVEMEPSIIDPAGGLRDLERKRIRMSDPHVLVEDPLRLLRSVRLAAHLEFEIDTDTTQVIRRHASLLSQVAVERLRAEFFAILHDAEAGHWLVLMDEYGLLEVLLPETRAMRGHMQGSPHRFDVLTHSLETVRSLDRILVSLSKLLPCEAISLIGPLEVEIAGGISRQALLRFAALVHDVGKPDSRSTVDGQIRFFGHAERGADLVHEISHRLRLGSRASAMTIALVREHLRPLSLRHSEPITPRARYRFWRDLGDLAPDLLILSLADIRATKGSEESDYRAHIRFVRNMFAFYHERMQASVEAGGPTRLMDGHELMAQMGLPPGPFVGFLLERLREEVCIGSLTTKEEALQFLKRHVDGLKQEFAKSEAS